MGNIKRDDKVAPVGANREMEAKPAPTLTLQRRHRGGDDPYCPMCKHPYRKDLEAAYMTVTLKLVQVAKLAGVSAATLKAHIRATGLMVDRAKETDRFRAYMINEAFEQGVMDAPKLDQVITLLSQVDRASGRDKAYDLRPVLIVGIPEPGGRIAPAQEVVIQGRVAVEAAPMPVPKAPKDDNEQAD